MIRPLLTLVFIALSAAWHFYPRQPMYDWYPGSVTVFKKYYPENEILGMANDESWQIVSMSKDSLDKINFWYDQRFIGATATENHSDSRCIRRAWREKNRKNMRITVCDHGSYRTILAVIPK